jgi:two-component system, cell cycle sensor histidine kinase and response regulator CckA
MQATWQRQAIKIALIYLIISVIWIIGSDRLVEYLISDPAWQGKAQTIKGWIFVLITASLLYWLVRIDLRKLSEHEFELQRLFENSTVGLAEYDLRGVQSDLQALMASGVGDLHEYLRRHQDRLRDLLLRIKPLRANRRFYDMLGHAGSQRAGFIDRLMAQDATGMARLLVAASKQDSTSVQLNLQDADGRPQILLTSMRPVNADRWLINLVDITALVQAQRSARRNEERFEEALQTGLHVLYRLNVRHGHYDYLSPTIKPMLGYDPEQWRRHSMEDVLAHVHSDDRPRLRSLLEKAGRHARNGRYTIVLDYRLRAADGQYRWMKDLTTLLYEGQELVAFVGAVYDQTESRELEAQLHQNHKMQAIGQLAGGVAHDFNNLLAGILGNAELLQKRIDDEDQHRLLERLIETTERASGLTARLLSFGRKTPLQSEAVHLQAIVEAVEDILGHSIDKRIKIVTRIEDVRATTVGDPSQIQNALLNLTLNARDAQPDGGVIEIRLSHRQLDEESLAGMRLRPEPGDYVVLGVHDLGSGMTPVMIDRIFEPFFTTKDVGAGTGLGLSAAYATMCDHGGGIAVSSEVGSGSSFELFFPFVLERDDDTTTDGSLTVAGQTKRSVLLVDDEELIRELVGEMLTSLGIRCFTAEDGVAAIEQLEQGLEVDLVICDLVMPRQDGQATVRIIRERWPQLPVIIATGYGDDQHVQQLRALGIGDLIAKPYRLQCLSDAIERVLG